MFPSFVGGSQVQSGTIAPMQTSPDGRYLLYLRTRSPAYGDLTLLNVATGAETVISTKVEVSLEAACRVVTRFAVHRLRQGLGPLLFLPGPAPGRPRPRRRAAEDRATGSSRTSAGEHRDAVLLSGCHRLRDRSQRAFHPGAVHGLPQDRTVVAKIPFQFDPNFDSFWVSPDGKNLLLNKGGRNIFLYYITLDDFHASSVPLSLPYLSLPRDTTVKKVIWSVETL